MQSRQSAMWEKYICRHCQLKYSLQSGWGQFVMPWLWTRSVIYPAACWRKGKSWAFYKTLFYCILSSPKYKILDSLDCSIYQQYALECWSTEFCRLLLEIWFLWSIEYIWVHLVFQVSIRQIYLSALSSKRLKYISQGFTIVEVSIGLSKAFWKRKVLLLKVFCWFALKIARVSSLKIFQVKMTTWSYEG